MQNTTYKQLIEEIAEGNKQLNTEDLPVLIDTYLDHNEEAFDNALVEWSDEIKTAYLQLLNGDHRLWNDLAHTFITKSLKDMISKDLEKKIDEIDDANWDAADDSQIKYPKNTDEYFAYHESSLMEQLRNQGR